MEQDGKPGGPGVEANKKPASVGSAGAEENFGLVKGGAGDAIRTRDIFLGKEVLYQLSYTRIFNNGQTRSHPKGCQAFFSGLQRASAVLGRLLFTAARSV